MPVLVFLFAVTVAAATLWTAPAHAATGSLTPPAGKRLHLTSFVAIRDAGVVRQTRDYSCGAAALATLLTSHWQTPTSESDILIALERIIPEDILEQRESSGLTLHDLQTLAIAHGFRAQGFRLTAEQVLASSGPLIAFIAPFGFKHFVTLRGISGDRVLLADPAHGNASLTVPQFLDIWLDDTGTGAVLAVEPLAIKAHRATPLSQAAP